MHPTNPTKELSKPVVLSPTQWNQLKQLGVLSREGHLDLPGMCVSLVQVKNQSNKLHASYRLLLSASLGVLLVSILTHSVLIAFLLRQVLIK